MAKLRPVRGARRAPVLVLVPMLVLVSCNDLAGLRSTITPLAQVHVEVTGDLTSVVPGTSPADVARLRVALVWGAQWLPEPFCVLPPDSMPAATVIAAGCRDNFGFVPLRVAANLAVQPGVPATLDLLDLPEAGDMVGDVTARVAYASLLVYEDRDGDGTLSLGRAAADVRPPGNFVDGGVPSINDNRDVVDGTSFLSMTLPDWRIAYREGDFDTQSAFYPRGGCPPPPKAFSALAAGGFSPDAALQAALKGMLPPEDPETCREQPLEATLIQIPLEASQSVRELICIAARNGSMGGTRYRAPPEQAPDLAHATWACAAIPNFSTLPGAAGGMAGPAPPPSPPQLVIAGPPTDVCKGLTHYTLRGCDNDANCQRPKWDRTQTPPSWWPCSTAPVAPTAPPGGP